MIFIKRIVFHIIQQLYSSNVPFRSIYNAAKFQCFGEIQLTGRTEDTVILVSINLNGKLKEKHASDMKYKPPAGFFVSS